MPRGRSGAAPSLPQHLAAEPGEVLASFGRQHEVQLADGSMLVAVRRGRAQDVACGDRVAVIRTEPGHGVIEGVAARSSLLFRADAFRQKVLAANVDLAVLVVAAQPRFQERLLTRCLAAAHAAGLNSLIVCNKQDLPETREIETSLDYYRSVGHAVLGLSARSGSIDALRDRLRGHHAILVGESGMGKSTLINALLPDAAVRTGELSLNRRTGRHTTTSARRYALADGGSVTDSPVMQVFGLQHLGAAELEAALPEFAHCIGACRFADCRHRDEPGCAFKARAAGQPAVAQRLAWLLEIMDENARIEPWARRDFQA